MNGKEEQLGEKVDLCDVCETPLDAVNDPIKVEKLGKVLTFCSEKCYKQYLEEPERYADFEDDEAME